MRRLWPAWSLGIAWGRRCADAVLRDLQLYDAAVLGVLYSTAAHGGRSSSGRARSAGVGAVVATVYLAS